MNLSFTLFGGLAPLVATSLFEGTRDAAAPSLFLVLAAVATLAAKIGRAHV